MTMLNNDQKCSDTQEPPGDSDSPHAACWGLLQERLFSQSVNLLFLLKAQTVQKWREKNAVVHTSDQQ